MKIVVFTFISWFRVFKYKCQIYKQLIPSNSLKTAIYSKKERFLNLSVGNIVSLFSGHHLNFGKQPVTTTCTNCNSSVTTVVREGTGTFQVRLRILHKILGFYIIYLNGLFYSILWLGSFV